jgi:hypothetical protein
MANQTEGFGCRMTMATGNTPATQGQSEYKIESGLGVGIYKNNPVSIQDAAGGSQGYLQDASFATTDDTGTGGASWTNTGHAPLIGVFNGAFYVNSTTSKPTWANSIAASTTFGTDYNTGSTDGLGFVNDNPQQEFVIKANTAVTQAMIGDAGYNVANFTASDAVSGQSTVKLDNGTTAAVTSMFKLVRGANDPENKDYTAINSNVIVNIARDSNLYN